MIGHLRFSCSSMSRRLMAHSVEFLPDNNNHDCLNCRHQVMDDHLALDLLDLVQYFRAFSSSPNLRLSTEKAVSTLFRSRYHS